MAIVRDMTDNLGFVCDRGANQSRKDDCSCLISLIVKASEFEVPKIGDLSFFHEREYQADPSAIAVDNAKGRHAAARIMKIQSSQTNLLEIVRALGTPSRFTRRLDRWQQQCYENSNDGDNDEQLNERECPSYTVTMR